MSAKLDKIGVDWKRALKKAADWSARAKELEQKYKEAENTEIHDLVHAAELTPDQLAEVLRALKAGALPSPAVMPTGEADGDDGMETEHELEEEIENED